MTANRLTGAATADRQPPPRLKCWPVNTAGARPRGQAPNHGPVTQRAAAMRRDGERAEKQLGLQGPVSWANFRRRARPYGTGYGAAATTHATAVRLCGIGKARRSEREDVE